MTAPEFSHPVKLDILGEAPRSVTLAADAETRAALARRFALVSIDRLEAQAAVRREGDAVIAEGRLSAAVVQSCVATGDPLPATIDEHFALRFVPAATIAGEEIELSEADLDTIPYEGGAIDLGEAVAEELSLALDPFPRSAHADETLRAAGVVAEGEEEVGPFAALKGLRDRMT